MAKQQDPAANMVIRNVSPMITTLSIPFLRFNKFKFGGRATIGEFRPSFNTITPSH